VSSREAVLGRIRAALDDSTPAPEVPRGYRVGTDLHRDAVLARFAERVGEYRATVHRSSPGGLAAVLASIVAGVGDATVVVPAGLPPAWLANLGDGVTVLTDDGALTAADLDRVDAVVTGCAVGIAETGTVVLDAAADQGRRALSLVPDHHLCVVDADRVVATVPEGLALLDPRRPLTLISGPSATSDIELNRVEGVHGPRTLDVVVVEAG